MNTRFGVIDLIVLILMIITLGIIVQVARTPVVDADSTTVEEAVTEAESTYQVRKRK